jgi:preprotein translocase subunit SecF
MIRIIQNRKIWLTLSSVLVGSAIIAMILWGLNFGIDFTGGSLLEVKFIGARPNVNDVQAELSDLELGSLIVQPVGEDNMILRFQDTGEDKHQTVLQRLDSIAGSGQTQAEDSMGNEPATASPDNLQAEGQGAENLDIEFESNDAQETALTNIEELRFDSVGPSIGEELKRKSIYAIFLVLIAIVLYIAWVFRKVSKPIASWKYGVTAIIALFHDVIITMGVFAVLGQHFNVEINTPFVAAILTVLGYSVNDTIVVFDRIRENLPRSDEDFEGTVNASVNQTITRSINTSLTTLLVLVSILLFGGGSIRDFVLALSIGVFIGTYSSIFLASPVLVVWERLRKS